MKRLLFLILISVYAKALTAQSSETTVITNEKG